MPTQEIQTQTYGQLKLLNIIRSITNSIGENLPFGHGMRSYANLERRTGILENEKQFPRAYLYPVSLDEKFDIAGQLDTTYICTMDFLTQCKLKDDESVIETALTEMFRLSSEFLIKLNEHPDRRQLENITREPNYFVFDANLCGWVLHFEIKIHEPNIC